MDKNTPAYWSLSLDTECPKCGHNFDLLCDADFWEFSGAKQACEEIKVTKHAAQNVTMNLKQILCIEA